MVGGSRCLGHQGAVLYDLWLGEVGVGSSRGSAIRPVVGGSRCLGHQGAVLYDLW